MWPVSSRTTCGGRGRCVTICSCASRRHRTVARVEEVGHGHAGRSTSAPAGSSGAPCRARTGRDRPCTRASRRRADRRRRWCGTVRDRRARPARDHRAVAPRLLDRRDETVTMRRLHAVDAAAALGRNERGAEHDVARRDRRAPRPRRARRARPTSARRPRSDPATSAASMSARPTRPRRRRSASRSRPACRCRPGRSTASAGRSRYGTNRSQNRAGRTAAVDKTYVTGENLSVKPAEARSAAAWGWFLAWFAAGALCALAVLGAFTIGIFVLPIAGG